MLAQTVESYLNLIFSYLLSDGCWVCWTPLVHEGGVPLPVERSQSVIHLGSGAGVFPWGCRILRGSVRPILRDINEFLCDGNSSLVAIDKPVRNDAEKAASYGELHGTDAHCWKNRRRKKSVIDGGRIEGDGRCRLEWSSRWGLGGTGEHFGGPLANCRGHGCYTIGIYMN